MHNDRGVHRTGSLALWNKIAYLEPRDGQPITWRADDGELLRMQRGGSMFRYDRGDYARGTFAGPAVSKNI